MLELKLSDQDLDFVIEVVDPELMARKDTIESDLSITEAILEQENERLFNRLMLMGREEILIRVSPSCLDRLTATRSNS